MQQIPVRNVPSTTTAVGGKIHVRLTEGKFQNLRRIISGPLLLAYLLLVWIEVDGQPWLLFDFSSHRIQMFGTSLSWYDLPLLAGVMIAGSALLFFMAVGWGRLWCGFACPQSIWTWLFIRIETFTEGRSSVRARQEANSLRGKRLLRRIAKHLLWLLAAFITALTFTGYFVPVRELVSDLAQLQLDWTSTGWLITMTALTYLNAGLAREKVCTHMCPYARFQGVMFDSATRTVSYDAARGEPRSNQRNRGSDSGDCVDCGLCVQVCPTGIDIRDGLQYECIDCAACIDACDAVMDKVGRERGLIRFASEQQLSKQSSPLWRPRLIGYAVVVMLSVAATVWGFSQRSPVLIEIQRERGALFQVDSANNICNYYQMKLEAFDDGLKPFQVILTGPDGLTLKGPSVVEVSLKPRWFDYRVCSPAGTMKGTSEIAFEISNGTLQLSKSSTFIAPGI
ncbi:cytochrome c oxidase accessory protein CcoG [Marinobacterium jannaschii]|uniref:cytochrome c oxidase accessory protein CcoG n=1 Tax=Marinobacterium jannaschii TaxID=64970 RepID=UPI000485DAF6|nr:cytochrome c oxidase accessory protein CcoG [Marinobacterium jannaschii]